MGIAVEEPVPEDHRHPRVRHPVGELAALLGGALLEIDIGELDSLQVLERHHSRRRVTPDHLWHGHLGRPAEVAPERLGVPRLVVVVELLANRPREFVDERLRIDEVEGANALADDLGRRAHQLQVGFDLTRRLGALNLDDDVVPGRQRRTVYLTDRRRGERDLVEGDECLLDREPDLLLDDPPDLRERDRRDVVL